MRRLFHGHCFMKLLLYVFSEFLKFWCELSTRHLIQLFVCELHPGFFDYLLCFFLISQIDSVDKISKVRITGGRTNREFRVYQDYEFDKTICNYTGTVYGYYVDNFSCNGGDSGDIDFKDDGAEIKRVENASDLPDARGLGLGMFKNEKEYDWSEMEEE